MSRSVRRLALAAMMSVVVLTACGSDSDSEDADDGGTGTTLSDAPGTTSATTPPSSASPSGDCPISAAALSTATSLHWELRERREDHPLETAESVKATVCIFTAAHAPQLGGDPLVLRTDVVTGADAPAERQRFADTCAESGGATVASGGGTACARDGVVVEGIKGEGDRLVSVYLVNADSSTATQLTPAFAGILTAVR